MLSKRLLILILCGLFSSNLEAQSRSAKFACTTLVGVLCSLQGGCSTYYNNQYRDYQRVTASDKELLVTKLKDKGIEHYPEIDLTYYPWAHADASRSREDSVSMLHLVHGEDVVIIRTERNFNLAKSLLNSPPDVLFHEGVEPYYDVKFKDLKDKWPKIYRDSNASRLDRMQADDILRRFGTLVRRVEDAFPNGLPESVDQLNNAQRVLLYNEGGAMVVFGLGLIPEIRGIDIRENKAWKQNEVGTWTGIIYKDAFKNPDFLHETFDNRETSGLARAIELYVSGEVSGRGAIIYGGGHFYEDYSNEGLRIRRLETTNEADLEHYRRRWPETKELDPK